MIEKVVDRMYAEIDDNRFLEVTYANGDKEVMYFKDFNSGAMIQNVVDRAKKNAIKSVLETGQPGLRIQHLLDSIVDEFAENEDLPNTTNPDDWARISGKKGERIVYIRTLVTGKSSSRASRAIDTESQPRPVPVRSLPRGTECWVQQHARVIGRVGMRGGSPTQVGVAAGQAGSHVDTSGSKKRCRYSGSTLVLTVKYSPDSTATNSDVCTTVCGIGMWTPNHVPAQGGSPTGQVSSADHSTVTSSGMAMMPSARKNANRPAVKNTTWIACDTTITATTLICSASDSGVRGG